MFRPPPFRSCAPRRRSAPLHTSRVFGGGARHALLVALALSVVASSSAAQRVFSPPAQRTPPAPTAPYVALDRNPAPWTNPGNLVPFRPLAATADGAFLYAVDTHASRVVRFGLQPPAPAVSWPVGWGPVSIALFDTHADGVPRLLVVSRGTHALVVLDRLTGSPLDWLDLPFEPADLLVDPAARRAFVACSGVDRVVEIDLAGAPGIVRSFAIPSEHPGFLSFDGAGNVLVAPMFSGNNSSVVSSAGSGFIVDLANPANSPSGGLPDQDLFRIVRATGVVAPVARATGTILFGHAVNPVTGKLWQLNLESKNKDPNRQSEAAVRGDFADNRLTLVTLPGVGGPIATGHTVINLDDTDRGTPAVELDPTRTVALPWSLSFAPDGSAVVLGLATSNATRLDSAGNWLAEWNLPAGALPRGAVHDPADPTRVYVHCWGTNEVVGYALAPLTGTPFATLDLGFDPTPELVKEGRRIFFDATHSASNHLTCATCHIDGRRDGLAWNLSDLPLDGKGPTVTQSLVGMRGRAPFHWRGERKTLKEFNPAFTGILGAPANLDETPGGDFDRFEAFMLSLTSTANPGQDPRRILNDALAPVERNGLRGSAVLGQQKFHTLISSDAPPEACVACHPLPTTTNNDIVLEDATHFAQQTHVEIPGFVELWRKEQDVISVDYLGTPTPMARTGIGLMHNGTKDDLFEFLEIFPVANQDRADISAFVRQIDEGESPMIHRGFLLDRSRAWIAQRIDRELLAQARNGWISVAARGRVQLLGAWRDMGWAFDPALDRFVPDDAGLPQLPLAVFASLAAQDRLSLIVVGLPLGNAAGWIDADRDDLNDGDEAARGTDPHDADTDGDGFFDGVEVRLGSDPLVEASHPTDTSDPVVSGLQLAWVTTRNASVVFRTNEPATARIDYSTSAGPGVQTVQSLVLARDHELALANLLPSTEGGTTHSYTATLTVTDACGRTSAVPIPGFASSPFVDTLSFPFFQPVAVTGSFVFTDVTHLGANSLRLRATIRMHAKEGGPPGLPVANYVAIGQVSVDGQVWSNVTTSHRQAFKVLGQDYTLRPGPFLVTLPTASNGGATFSVTLNGLTAGQKATLNVIAVFKIDPATHSVSNPDFGNAGNNAFPFGNWSFPDTPPALRSLSAIY